MTDRTHTPQHDDIDLEFLAELEIRKADVRRFVFARGAEGFTIEESLVALLNSVRNPPVGSPPERNKHTRVYAEFVFVFERAISEVREELKEFET